MRVKTKACSKSSNAFVLNRCPLLDHVRINCRKKISVFATKKSIVMSNLMVTFYTKTFP